MWFASVSKYNKGFIEDVEQWLPEITRPVSECVTDDNVEKQSKNKECENLQNTHKMEDDATFGAVHDDI